MTSQPRTERPPVHLWEAVDLPALTFDPTMTMLLRDEPVSRIRLPFAGDLDAWLVTRYQDVKAVASDPRFSREALRDIKVTAISAS